MLVIKMLSNTLRPFSHGLALTSPSMMMISRRRTRRKMRRRKKRRMKRR